jgi:hypothetical protein
MSYSKPEAIAVSIETGDGVIEAYVIPQVLLIQAIELVEKLWQTL